MLLSISMGLPTFIIHSLGDNFVLEHMHCKKTVLSGQKSRFFLGLLCMGLLFGVSPAFTQTEPTADLPQPGTMVSLSAPFTPVTLKGLMINPENSLAFDFIVDRGQVGVTDAQFKQEAQNLIKYFLAALTIPEDKSWVNLSPYEGNRIIPDLLATTEMGKQMLEQDYLLKQLSASLTNPQQELGKKFWDRVYQKAFELYGSTDVPINTFNKVWILPQKAVVLEQDGHVFISSSRLKVMMDEDYTALKANEKSQKSGTESIDQKQVAKLSAVSSQMIKEIIIPELEKEVNEGQNFAPVRQIYNSVILATWYKLSLKQSLLGQIYVDQGKIKGVDIPDKDVKQRVYDQYLEAFRRGVYSLVKEEYDNASQEVIARKYFSGGLTMATSNVIEIKRQPIDLTKVSLLEWVNGAYAEKPAEEGFYTTLTSAQKGALKSAVPFNPLTSPNQKVGHWDDGTETIFAYDALSEATYVVFNPTAPNPIVVRIPGKLSDSELIFSAFRDARDFRQWLDKNSALSRDIAYQQQGFFHAALAKAILSVDEDIDFERNDRIRNILSLMEYLQGAPAVVNLKTAMSQATPAGRQRILDNALAAALIAHPGYILNAAQLLGLDVGNPQLTVSKDIVGGMMINTYNTEDDKSIFIVRRGLEQTFYGVKGNLEPMLNLSDAFATAKELDEFLSKIKTSKNTGSGFSSSDGDYILNGDYLLALARARLIPESEFKKTLSVNVAEVSQWAQEDNWDDDAGGGAIIATPEARKDTFVSRLLPKLFAKVTAGIDYIHNFLKRYTIARPSARLINKSDGQIRIEYNPQTHQTTFRIAPVGKSKETDEISFMLSRNVFNGDLREIEFENIATAHEIHELLKIAEGNGFSAEQRVHLLEEMVAAQTLADKEFEITSEGKYGVGVEDILNRFRNINVDLKTRLYFEMSNLSAIDARRKYFIEVFLPQMVENLEHQIFVAERTNSKLPEFEDENGELDLADVPETVLIQKIDGTITISFDKDNSKSNIAIQARNNKGEISESQYFFEGDWRHYSLDHYNTVQEIQRQMSIVAQSKELTSSEQYYLLRIVNAARALPLSEFRSNHSGIINYVTALINIKSAEEVKKLFREMRMNTDLREKQNRFVSLLVALLSEKPDLFTAVGQALKVDFQAVRPVLVSDSAVSAAVAASGVDNRVGGIDFDAQLLDLQIKRDGRGVALPLPQQNLDQIHIEGLYPVIFNIQPVNAQTMPLLFGRSTEKPSRFPIVSTKSIY